MWLWLSVAIKETPTKGHFRILRLLDDLRRMYRSGLLRLVTMTTGACVYRECPTRSLPCLLLLRRISWWKGVRAVGYGSGASQRPFVTCWTQHTKVELCLPHFSYNVLIFIYNVTGFFPLSYCIFSVLSKHLILPGVVALPTFKFIIIN